jgi:anti-sigma factor RsiW
MMNHPTEQQLSAYHDGELPAAEREALSAHLLLCKLCMDRIDQLKQISSMIATSTPVGMSQIALHRLHARLDEVMEPVWERGLIRWAWEVSGIAAAILVVGSIWLAMAGDPANASASVSVPPWVASRATADPVVGASATPAAEWYLVDARNSSDSNP